MPDRTRAHPVSSGPFGLRLLERLLPVRCPACRTPADGLCAGCRVGCRPAPLLALPSGLEACVAVHAYAGPARQAVLRAKAAGAHALYGSMAVELVRAASSPPIRSMAPTVVTWPPTTVVRRRRRGYDPAERLARGVADGLGMPCRSLLARLGAAQAGRDASERAAVGFAAQPGSAIGERVLLVDDVRTTGATLAAAGRALRAAGASAVVAVTFAATR